MLKIIPIDITDVTKLVCPHCKEKVSRVGLTKESQVVGLVFKCKRCSKFWEVRTE